MRRLSLLIPHGLALGACTTYRDAENFKLMSFEEQVPAAQSVGPVKGEDCVWSILGYALGTKISLDQAMANARTQTASTPISALQGGAALSKDALKYMTGVNTSWDGFDAKIIAKTCLVVKGVGYR